MRYLLLLIAATLVVVRPSSTAFGEPPTAPTVGGSALRIEFDPRHGAMHQVTDVARQRTFLAIDSAPQPLWMITLIDGTQIHADNASEFRWYNAADHSQTLTLRWTGLGIGSAPNLTVTATVAVDQREATSRWTLAVDGLDELAVRAVTFPRTGLIARRQNETLAVPVWIGQATDRARELVNNDGQSGRLAWDFPGHLSMQMMAFYDGNGHGLMLSTDDTRLLRKEFGIFGDGATGVGMEVAHVPEGEHARSTNGLELSYAVELRVFDGDWFTAAEHYRKWSQNQWWVRDSRMRTGQTPAWVRDTALWVWNRGRSDAVLEPAVVLQRQAEMPVSVFWHWWHGCPYDIGFPEYLPPREGTESFRAATTSARNAGVRSIVYMNQRLWGMTTESWKRENAAAAAVKQPDGSIAPEVYNTFTQSPCASMCMGTPFWRDKYAGLAETVVRDLGVAGIYMDQACSSLACYDPSHGHPQGGGTYWMDGFKSLAADIRTRCGPTSEVALAGEGCGEGWLPYLDIMLSLQVSLERYHSPGYWQPLPLFNAVYHDCAIQYGNYSSLTRPPYDELWPAEKAPADALALLDRKFALQFRLEQARSLVWGQQPTLANFQQCQLSERAEEIAFFLQVARLRQQALEYLRDGVMLRPPAIDAPTREIPMSRLSIYAGQGGAVQEFTQRVPTVLASAWRAPDGSVGLVLINIDDKPATVALKLPGAEYALPETVELEFQLDSANKPRAGVVYRVER